MNERLPLHWIDVLGITILTCVSLYASCTVTRSEIKRIEDKIDRIEKNIGYLPPLQNVETRKEIDHD